MTTAKEQYYIDIIKKKDALIRELEDQLESDHKLQLMAFDNKHRPPQDIPEYIARELFKVEPIIMERSERWEKFWEKEGFPAIAEAIRKNAGEVMFNKLADHPDIIADIIREYGAYIRYKERADLLNKIMKMINKIRNDKAKQNNN